MACFRDTPKDHLYGTIVGEVAELATRELPDERNALGQSLNSVFFFAEHLDGTESPLWVGPNSRDAFVKAMSGANVGHTHNRSLLKLANILSSGRAPVKGRGPIISSTIQSWDVYLLRNMTRRSAALVRYRGPRFLNLSSSARHTLRRVEHITETVARIGSEDLAQRLAESTSRDEISRLAKTFNLMLDRIQSSVNQLRSVTDAVAHDLREPGDVDSRNSRIGALYEA